VPHSQGGSSKATNAQLTHADCNRFKGTGTNHQFQERLARTKLLAPWSFSNGENEG
jgi:hypothetical protein